MQVGASAAAGGAYLINVLRASQQMQAEMVEKLIASDLQVAQDVQKMETAGRIVDVYA
jgi:hypothetical protein